MPLVLTINKSVFWRTSSQYSHACVPAFPSPSKYVFPSNSSIVSSLVQLTTMSDSGGEPSEGAPRNTNTKNYIVGLGLLIAVVLLWTVSSFLTQVSTRPHFWAVISIIFYRTCMTTGTRSHSCECDPCLCDAYSP